MIELDDRSGLGLNLFDPDHITGGETLYCLLPVRKIAYIILPLLC